MNFTRTLYELYGLGSEKTKMWFFGVVKGKIQVVSLGYFDFYYYLPI